MLVDERRASVSPAPLAGAVAAVAATGTALPALAPDPLGSARSLGGLQRLADTAGADTVVVRVAGLLLWLVWAWGAVGLGLTAATALPGAAGALARLLLRVAVPGAARRCAGLALGVGIGLNGSVVAGAVLASPALAVVPAGPPTAPAVPDWPTATPEAPAPPVGPDRPASPGTATHLVVRGDCLWRIAASALDDGHGASAAEVAGAVRAWWSANASVIGPDPDLLLPGQVLHAPAAAPRGGDR
jgi:hypothetical protein